MDCLLVDSVHICRTTYQLIHAETSPLPLQIKYRGDAGSMETINEIKVDSEILIDEEPVVENEVHSIAHLELRLFSHSVSYMHACEGRTWA